MDNNNGFYRALLGKGLNDKAVSGISIYYISIRATPNVTDWIYYARYCVYKYLGDFMIDRRTSKIRNSKTARIAFGDRLIKEYKDTDRWVRILK